MKRYEIVWKHKPFIEIENEDELEQEKENILIEISMNICDYLDFEEVEG